MRISTPCEYTAPAPLSPHPSVPLEILRTGAGV
jgi:hypothetical protein